MFFFLFYLLHISPIFSAIETIQIRENVNVTINCHLNLTRNSVHQSAEKIILWYKDETQVIGVNAISNNPTNYLLSRVNEQTYQLTIINVQLESAGLYKCQSFTAKEEQYFQIDVLVPPSRLYLHSSSSLPVIDGSLVSFNCTSERVYPNPIFEWYEDGKVIQRSIGNQTFFSSSSILTLLLTPADHNHTLRCQVSNEASIDRANMEMKLEILFKPIVKLFFEEREINTRNFTIVEGTFAIVHCRISSNPSIVDGIQWLKNDQLILGETNEQLGMNFTGINKLSCRAKNSLGETEDNIHLNLLYQPKLSMIENLTLIQGEKLILTCLINSNPLCYEIRWLYNNQELRSEPCTKQNQSEYVIDNIDRLQAGKYTCEVKNRLNNNADGISQISTDVRIQYAPIVFNSYEKLAVTEGEDIRTECIVDAYPRAEITWFGPSNEKLNPFTEEKSFNSTVRSSILHLPPSYSSILGSYRCVAKNNLGEDEFSIEFQRPNLPDPPYELAAMNITHSSFILHWQSGYDGGSEQIFHISLNGTETEEHYTNFNRIRLKDLNEKTLYTIRIRSKNEIGYSDYSDELIVRTREASIRSDDFPLIERAYFTKDSRRIRFQLSTIRSRSLSIDQLCIRYYNNEKISSCIPLNSFELIHQELEITIEQRDLRLKLCLINQTDICSKSISMPNDLPLLAPSSDWILMLTGGIIGLCLVIGLTILFICILRQKRKQRSKNGSTDTLKSNSEHCHSIPSVRVSDTSSTLYHPTRPIYYNDETTGIYSIQEKKSSMYFDSGMPSITSNNSDSLTSQALSASDFDDRSDGEYLVHGRTTTQIPFQGRISSEEESGFSTPTKAQHGRKLVYEVVV